MLAGEDEEQAGPLGVAERAGDGERDLFLVGEAERAAQQVAEPGVERGDQPIRVGPELRAAVQGGGDHGGVGVGAGDADPLIGRGRVGGTRFPIDGDLAGLDALGAGRLPEDVGPVAAVGGGGEADGGGERQRRLGGEGGGGQREQGGQWRAGVHGGTC